ncbi:TPA: hypothetical protein ACIIU2_003537, partial [Providencia stuartii]
FILSIRNLLSNREVLLTENISSIPTVILILFILSILARKYSKTINDRLIAVVKIAYESLAALD